MVKIRKARKGNLKEIAKLMKTEFSKPPFKERDSIRDVLKSLDFYFKIGEIFIVIIDGEIAGIIVIKFEQWWGGKVLLIEDLAVNEKFKGQDIGKKLMKFIENYAKKKKAKFILFDTHRKSKAIQFYKKLGYKQNKNTIFMGKKLK